MALRGKVSEAHVYNKDKECIYCKMYEWNVVMMSHACTVERERFFDLQRLAAIKKGEEERLLENAKRGVRIREDTITEEEKPSFEEDISFMDREKASFMKSMKKVKSVVTGEKDGK